MKLAIIILAGMALVFAFVNPFSNKVLTLKKGDQIPNFELKDQNGDLVHIDEFRGGKNMVIFFYPKDDTPGCTKEACKFRDEYSQFSDMESLVIGVSSDTPGSHMDFVDDNKLPFTLLSDINNEVRNMFGVNDSFLGLVPGRVTFVINKEGVIEYVFDSMSKVDDHVSNALLALTASI